MAEREEVKLAFVFIFIIYLFLRTVEIASYLYILYSTVLSWK